MSTDFSSPDSALSVDLELAASPPWYRHCGNVAWHGILLDTFLPSLPHRQTHRSVLHRRTSVCFCCGLGVGGLPKDGRFGWVGRLSVDVPPIWPCWYYRWNQPPLVATGSTIAARGSQEPRWLAQVDPSEQTGSDRGGCQNSL